MNRFVYVVIGWACAAFPWGHAEMRACGPAPPPGYHADISEEFAVIVWDPETRIEHFIRVAEFVTDAPELGFLVPTPTVPELFEVNVDSLAGDLNDITKQRTEYRTEVERRFGLGPWPYDWEDNAAGAAPPSSVEVLGEYAVGGYDASVLRANDPTALGDWLDKHDFETTDALRDWLAIYTEQEWIITAFRVAKDGPSVPVRSRGVRMTFETERPFYPYREPVMAEKPRTDSRTLRVFLLADQRYDGRIGTERDWPAKTVWSDTIGEHWARRIARALDVPHDLPRRLTEYSDHSFPRPGVDELYFHPAATQAPVERPPRIRTRTVVEYYPGWGWAVFLGLALATVAGIVLLAIGWQWYRRRSAGSSS